MPEPVVIVGGSLAGLMHGIALKRQGRDVTILERDPTSERSSHHAGLTFYKEMHAFLDRYDRTGVQIDVPHTAVTVSYGKNWPHLLDLQPKIKVQLTSWGAFYRLLRANFDGYASKVCPEPPPDEEGDGKAQYLSGKEVTGLRYEQGIVTLDYRDVVTGKEQSIDADLVVGADGVHSTVRKLVNAPSASHIGSYVIWRGTVPESLLSKETLEYFEGRTCFAMMKIGYVVIYTIPTDNGSIKPGERLINFVWYCTLQSESDLKAAFTDKNGTLHRNTVGPGLLNQDIWQRYVALCPSMTHPALAELIAKCPSPFITKPIDVICEQWSFYDGHVILAGDALATFKPHIAQATEMSAFTCNSYIDVIEGKLDEKVRERQLNVRANKLLLLSRLVGLAVLRRPLSTLGALVSFLTLLVKQKLGMR